MSDNVFVLGMDERNRRILEHLPAASEARFHPLFGREQLVGADEHDLRSLLQEARWTLDDTGSVDAIVGYWDFPVTSLVALLCRERRLPGPRLEGVVACEHKYWSRREQAEVLDEEVPAFGLVPLGEDVPGPPGDVGYPCWLKPVKSMSSRLAFRVEDERDFRRAIKEIEADIDTFSRPFDVVLEHADLPPDIAAVGSRACIAEEPGTGRQFTAEGYCVEDEPHVYALVETVLYPGSSNFQRYEYPASVPDDVADRMVDATERVIRRVGLGSSTFDIEYFWDEETDRIRLLEVNPRLSQAHAEITGLVDGAANLQAMVALGLGRDPRMPRREGPYAVAGRFFPRVFEDGVVTDEPDAARIEQVKRDIPGVASIVLAVHEGERLSELPEQDPYSYALGDLVLGAEDSAQLQARYEGCLDALGLVVEEPGEDTDA